MFFDTPELIATRQSIYKKYNLLPEKIPRHIAMIMDGNGRWAKKRLMPRKVGHRAGSEALRKTIKACTELGIKYLTVYVFSTENWKRPEDEVNFLMDFFKELVVKEIPELNREGAKIRCLGQIDGLPKDVQTNIQISENQTQDNNRIQINLMINYGSRAEIVTAVKKIAKDFSQGKIHEIDEQTISNYLYTSDIPDPDILIRTGGDFRLSNYLLWQVAYTEFFYTNTLWPDFNRENLIDIISKFQDRERRFGGLT